MAKVPGFVKVYWVKAHWGYAYSAGETGIVLAEKAPELLEKGFIIPLPEEEEKAPEKVNPLPADFPARTVLFDAGYESLDQIKAAGDSLLDAGISNTTLRKIKNYLK